MQTPAGIDAGSQAKGDVERADRLVQAQAAHFDQSREAKPLRLPNRAQPCRGKEAILPAQGHQIGQGTQGGDVEKLLQINLMRHLVTIGTEAFEQTVDKLEDQPHRTHLRPRLIRPVEDMGVDEYAVLRESLLARMMIQDDHIDALRAQFGDHFARTRPAVHRDQ